MYLISSHNLSELFEFVTDPFHLKLQKM